MNLNWLTATLFLLVINSSACVDYQLKTAAKSPTDLVVDAHIQKTDELMQNLMIKLYKRNPRELQKTPNTTIQSRLNEVFAHSGEQHFPEFAAKSTQEILTLPFDPLYQGDRVFAFMVGLSDMVHKSYGYQTEYFMLDSINGQDLYNSARNIETLIWRMKHHFAADGDLYLLTNGYDQNIENLSFERLFGKLISLQDMMARISADSTNRTINKIVHSVASTVLLPVGI
jgi:hypothetical protein